MHNKTVGNKQETIGPSNTFVNRDASRTRLIAGVSVPDGPLITAVIEYAQRFSEPYLLNHAMRSWLFAEAMGRIKGIDYDREVVAIGTILHDIGLTPSVSGPQSLRSEWRRCRTVVHQRQGSIGSPGTTNLEPGCA